MAGEQRDNKVENEKITKKDEEELATEMMKQENAAEQLAKNSVILEIRQTSFSFWQINGRIQFGKSAGIQCWSVTFLKSDKHFANRR